MSSVKRAMYLSMFVSLFLFMVPSFVAAASHTETFELETNEINHQFIIEGEGDFDVQLELPDGTKIDYEEFDQSSYMYFGLQGKRMWVVADAKAGTYTFHITSPSEDDHFTVSDKASIEQPEIIWESPTNETVSAEVGDQIDVTWKIEGEVSDTANNMHFYLRSEDGWYLIPITSVTASREETSLSIPYNMISGTYDLIVEIDDLFIVGEIETELKIDVDGDADREKMIEIIDQEILNDVLYITFTTDRNAYFSHIEAQFISEGDAPAFTSSLERDDLVLLEQDDDGNNVYIWPIGLDEPDPGTYEGQMIIRDNELPMSKEVAIESFTILERVEGDTSVTWSIEEGKTSELFVEMTVQANEGTVVRVEDDGTVLLEEAIPEGEEEATFQIPLLEGFRILEVTLQVSEQYSETYAQRYQVDHTPPRLEMIHPLPSLAKMDETYVSGYVEVGSTLYVNEEEVSYDETGYFRVDTNEKEVHVRALDENGNETVYSWAPNQQAASTSSLPLFIAINGSVIAATAGCIWFLRRKRNRPEQ